LRQQLSTNEKSARNAMTEARAAAGRTSAAPSTKAANAPNALQKALHKMGLVRDMDLALHLPLRYEDETCITPLAQALASERLLAK